jgi:predicted permease
MSSSHSLKEKKTFNLSTFLEGVWWDMRIGLRSLIMKPGFTFLVVLSLGLGIGANTVIFSVIDGILLRPVAVPHPSDIVTIDTAASHVTRFGDSSYLDYLDYSKQTHGLLGMLVYRRAVLGLDPDPGVDGSRAQVIWGLLVSGNYFSLLDVKPFRGRGFLPEEDQALGKTPVAIISYSLWHNTFNGDSNVVGKPIKLNGHVNNIVGVAPPSFRGLDLSYRPDIYVPMSMIGDIVPGPGTQLLQSRHSRSFVIRGRLRPGVSLAEAQAEANVICSNLSHQYPMDNKDVNFILRRDLDYRLESNGAVLSAVLLGLVVFVLLIACANVASLLMARATGRLGATATQLALGASRKRLFRQMITESTVLLVLGGVFGLILTWIGIRLAVNLVPYQPAPQGPLFQLDMRVMIYAAIACAMTIFLCGLAPAFMATREAARAALKIRSASNRSLGALARRVLIGCQVALSVILLIAGALFLKAFAQLQNYQLGFNPDNVFVISINPGLYNYSATQTTQFYKELLDRTSNMPGIKSVAVGAISPFLGLYSQDILIDGYATPGGDKVIDTLTNRISPTYFDTLQIPFLQGRKFTDNDKVGMPPVAIVNETFARRFIVGNGDLSGALNHIFRRRDNVPIQVIGIVKDSVYGGNTPLGSPAAPEYYTPFLQGTDSYAVIMARAEGNLQGLGISLQQTIHDMDPAIALIYNLPLKTVVTERALYLPRVTAVLSGVFAFIALTLAIIGLYGVVSYTVECRTREIGIRIALGAQRSSVLGMILASSISLVVAGLVAGVVGALMLSRYVSGLLIGVSPRDPLIFIALPLALLAVTIIASLIPASRATRVEPVTALRYE